MSLEILSLIMIRQILNNANRLCKKVSKEMRQTTVIFHNTTWTTILLQRKLPRHNADLDRKLQILSGRQILLCARSEIAVYKSYIVSNNASFTPMIATLWEKTYNLQTKDPRGSGVFLNNHWLTAWKFNKYVLCLCFRYVVNSKYECICMRFYTNHINVDCSLSYPT